MTRIGAGTGHSTQASGGALRVVLGDQLTADLSSLRDIDPARDVVLMAEVMSEGIYAPHHKQKIAFVLSAMRHFADDLRARGLRVDYIRLDDPANTQTLMGEVTRALARHDLRRIVVTEPGEWRVADMVAAWGALTGITLDQRDDDRFFCSRDQFTRLTAARKTGRMENFYRHMRKVTGLLMADDGPEGGQWNFDHDNRKPLPRAATLPRRLRFAPDAITQEVMALVADRFPDHFGTLDGFGWAVTRADALRALDHFITDCLPSFGDYQDAMKAGDDFLFHGVISPYLNIGLLTGPEVCLAAVDAWRAGRAPLNAVEGFVRQILGWREFVRGIYWSEGPGYGATNHLNATRDLPWLYWSGDTDMHCMADCIRSTRDHAYAHHIQRLMVTGNFALLAGISPPQVAQWYLAVYADAFEWVELPNVQGMALHADGGRIGSKPYAASGAYIDRMSDYCAGCAYDVAEKTGPQACPFNYLYWDFLMRNAPVLENNARMALPYRTLARMTPQARAAIRDSARAFLAGLDATGRDRGPARLL